MEIIIKGLCVPAIEVESSAGSREITLYSRHLSNRTIFIQGEINEDVANAVLVQLMYLQNEGTEDINLYINSPGGIVTSGLMIYDLIQSIETPVNMFCTAIAGSMAAVILAGGQKGRRFILPHSKTMIHEPLLASGIGGSATSIKNIADSILETRTLINYILAKHTGKTVEEINEATSFDHFMNAEESVQFGICDEIRNNIFS